VLARDGYRCRVQVPGVCIGAAPLHAYGDVPSGHVHHVFGKAAGDDPAYMVASCQPCNLHVGDPTRKPDPDPRPMTRW
jgi:hypothetical protein